MVYMHNYNSMLDSINVVNRLLGWVTARRQVNRLGIYNQPARSTQPSILCGMVNEYQLSG